MTTAPTFRDPSVEASYRRAGFVVRPLLDQPEVEHLRAGYRALVPPGDHGLTVDYMRPDRSYLHDILELVEPVLRRRLPELFADHRAVLRTFVTKHPGPASDVYLHEDRTLVDERRFRSATLWIPLVDVGPDLDNGTIELVPGSHRLNRTMSGTDTPELFRAYESYLRGRLQPVAVPAGHALCYDMRTLHASQPNLSAEPREALVCAVAPRSAEIIHVIGTSRRHRRVHRIDEAFFLDVHPHAIDSDTLAPRWPLIDEFDDTTRIDPAEVVELLGPHPHHPDPGPLPPPAPPGLRIAPRRLPLVDDDLPLASADLTAPSQVAAPKVRVEVEQGAIGAAVVGGAAALGGAGDSPVPRWADLLRPSLTDVTDGADAAIVAIDGRSHGTVHLGTDVGRRRRGSADRWTIDLIDVAPGTVDLGVGDSTLLLDESMRLEVDGAIGPLELTNRGTGVATLLISTAEVAPARRGPIRARASELRTRTAKLVGGTRS